MEQTTIESIIDQAATIDWSAWITAIATFVLAVLTFTYVRLTGKILSAQSDPCVVLTVVHDEERPTILQLVVRNIGAGLADDIRFEFSRPLPARAFGPTEADANEASEMESGPLIDGIPALGPGECRKVDWGQYGGLMAALGNERILATCKFKKNGRNMRPVKCPLEVASFVGTAAVESSAAKIASELEKITGLIKKLNSASYCLKVDVVSLPRDSDDESRAQQ
jgi:hypothetical protein